MEGVQFNERVALRKGDGLWFALAVLAHLLLLSIPVGRQLAEHPPDLAIAVSLLRSAPAWPDATEPPPAPVEVSARKRPPVPLEPATTPTPELPQPEPRAPGAIEFLESARSLELAPSPSTPRVLGEFRPPPPPSNWQPSITVEENLFGEYYLPSETEVVDRWLAADGSHNVVIRAPNGMTLCGRAQPWNPMQPLVEHVMMFHECAGGGKRTFTMPERFLRR